MSFDAHSNLALASIVAAPVPAATGNSLTVAAGFGALFPVAPFNCTVYPAGSNPTAANAEIVRVTAVVGDVFTIVRAQEGSTARSIVVGDQIANTATVKTFTDIENAIVTPAFSAQGGSSTFATLPFNNANGLTFSNNAGSVEASYTVPSTAGLISAINFSAGTTSGNQQSIVFSNSNNVTFGLNNGTITLSIPAGAAPGSISAGANSVALGQVVFSNSNGVTFGLNGSTVTASHNGLTSFQAITEILAGTQGAGTAVSFVDSNGITFGMSNNSVITASHNGLTSQSNQAASASNGSFTFQTLAFSNANNVTFGTSAGSIITASVNTAAAGNSVNFSAGTQSSNLASVVFSNSNGITFGLSNGTITASASGGGGEAVISSFQYPDPWVSAGTVNYLSNGNSYVEGVLIPSGISVDYIRFNASMATNSSTIATFASASATGFGRLFHTHAVSIFTRGTGASSNSIFSVVSGSAVMTILNSISISNSTQASYTQAITMPLGTGSTTFSTQYSSSQTNYSFVNPWFSILSGNRFDDIPLNTTLPAGNYWIFMGQSTTFSSAGAGGLTALTRNNVRHTSILKGNQGDVVCGEMGAVLAVVSTSGLYGAGQYAGTMVDQIALTDISRVGSNAKLLFQMLIT